MSNASPYSLDGVSTGEAMVANNALQQSTPLSPEQIELMKILLKMDPSLPSLDILKEQLFKE